MSIEYDGPGRLPLVQGYDLHQTPHPFDTPTQPAPTDAVDRLLAACQRAAQGAPDPYAALLRAQCDIVVDTWHSLGNERDALQQRGQLPELQPAYRERWAHTKGAADVYDIAARRVPRTEPSQWDGRAVHATLLLQARTVRLLRTEWEQARESGDDHAEPFARWSVAQNCYLAGVHAAIDLSRDAAAMLAVAVIGEVTA